MLKITNYSTEFPPCIMFSEELPPSIPSAVNG